MEGDGGVGGEFGSDACSIVHALPPICSPHSAAAAETLRRLKGQIAHTKRVEKERGLGGEGGVEKREREGGGGEREGLTPLHSDAISLHI